MSKSRLSVHVRVYRGRELAYNSTGQSTNENHIVKLEYDTPEYKRFLSMLKANGFIKATIEKVVDLSKVIGKHKNESDYYEEVKDFKEIQKEFDLALNPEGAEKELTADQKRMAKLEADNAEMKEALAGFMAGGKKAKEDTKKEDSKDTKSELSDDQKESLKVARDAYFELFGKKGHHSWTAEEINQKIAEFKPE